jgi:hypothetical protein
MNINLSETTNERCQSELVEDCAGGPLRSCFDGAQHDTLRSFAYRRPVNAEIASFFAMTPGSFILTPNLSQEGNHISL